MTAASGVGRDNHRWVRPAGTASGQGWTVALGVGVDGGEVDGWGHTGLLVGELAPGVERVVDLGSREAIVLPLSCGPGVQVGVRVESAAGVIDEMTLAGRASVWAGASDCLYVPTGSRLTLTAAVTGREATGSGASGRGSLGLGGSRKTATVAVLLAADTTGRPPPPGQHVLAHEVPVEHRGAGIASRQVRNFGVPRVLDANRIIACEVITPAGHWSSWPPHKHDTERPGVEAELEEIYYFQTRSIDPRGANPVGYQRVYAADDRPIDVLAEVRTNDVVLVPHGWHGPAMAAPDADLYYLNVMAGPGPTREWLICDDPAHTWVRDTWA